MTHNPKRYETSSALFEKAQAVIPGGVNSPVRAFASVNRTPIFVESAHGCKLKDVDGNVYTDFVCSWGPLILGHSPEGFADGIEAVFKKGTSYGIPTAVEVEMAEMIVEAYPGIDKVRMVNSGTEATMSAIRLARGFTGKDKLIKFEGCYHGHSDALLVKSGSGTLTYGVPTSPGVPSETVQHTVVGRYNDIAYTEELFERNKGEIACVIVEPMAGNMGVVPADADFLKALRALCDTHGALLIFDEVITGFRLAYGGAASVYGVKPDIVCFGKIIGGGLPVGAYAGSDVVMSKVSPLGPVYQAGTLSGNPLAMYMGLKTLSYLKDHPEVYDELEAKSAYLEAAFKPFIEANALNVTFVRFKGIPCLFFAKGPFKNYDDVKRCDTEAYAAFFGAMLDRGFLLPPAQFEGLFLSTAHTQADLDAFIENAKEVLLSI